MSEVPRFASATEALGMLQSAMSYLTVAAMAAEPQAQCLQMLERADAMRTAARALILGAFIAGQGYAADADYSPRSWLIHRTRITRGAAAEHAAPMRPGAPRQASRPGRCSRPSRSWPAA